jgi:hypothetical protein
MINRDYKNYLQQPIKISRPQPIQRMAKVVFEFKKKYYLSALVARDFNITQTIKDLGASKNDLRNHAGSNKEEQKQNARLLGLLE